MLVTVWLDVCSANDDAFSVELINNTGNTVIVKPCNGTCHSYASSVVLQSGHSMSTVQDPDGYFRPIKVTTPSGSTLGCLPFRFSSTPAKMLSVDISKVVSCGTSGGNRETQGHDWPID